MNHRVAKAVFGVVASGVLVAGCATTVDWGTPLGHYRYNYDSRPVVLDSTVTVPSVTYRESTGYVAPATTYVAPTTTTTYSAPVTTYRAPVTTYSETTTVRNVPSTTYRESRSVYPETTVTYYGPPPVYMYPTPSLPYTDHGQ